MKLNFDKDITDIARFRNMLIEAHPIVTDVSFDNASNTGYCIVADGTSQTEQDAIVGYIADYQNTLSAEEQLIRQIDYTLKMARVFAFDLINDFTNENIRLGITQAGKTKYVRTTLAELYNCVTTLSFYDAILECDIIIDKINDPLETDYNDSDTFINIARMTKFKNLIQKFLGVPLT